MPRDTFMKEEASISSHDLAFYSQMSVDMLTKVFKEKDEKIMAAEFKQAQK